MHFNDFIGVQPHAYSDDFCQQAIDRYAHFAAAGQHCTLEELLPVLLGDAEAPGAWPQPEPGRAFELTCLEHIARESAGRAANARGPGGPTGPLRTPPRSPSILSR